jgi:hypothetical protein
MDDLTLAIGDALIGQALDGWRPTGQWRADRRAIGLRTHAVYVGHPKAAVLTAGRVTGRANELDADEDMWRSTYARLPRTTHPRIDEAAPLLVARMVSNAYPTALGMLVDSAARTLPGDGPGSACDIES